MSAAHRLLTFGTSNRKLVGRSTATFALPAGFTCPGALECLSRFDRTDNKVVDGKNLRYRCYAASLEALRPNVRASVDRNFRLLKEAGSEDGMSELIRWSLPGVFWKRIRIHTHGDFFSAPYFRAWCKAAEAEPSRTFYAYTKNLPVWAANKEAVPDNLILTASAGGRWDALIAEHGFRQAVVVFHPEEAAARGLEIDHDDSHACERGPDFALLLHGTQPKGSAASAALRRMDKENIKFSYS